jgi:hypothetical protein
MDAPPTLELSSVLKAAMLAIIGKSRVLALLGAAGQGIDYGGWQVLNFIVLSDVSP